MIRMSDVWDRSAALVAVRRRQFAAIAVFALFVPFAVQEMMRPIQKLHPLVTAVVGLLALLVVLWGYAAVQALALAPDADVTAARRLATQRYPVIVGFTVLIATVVAIAMLPALGLIAAAGIDWSAMQAGQAGVISPAQMGAFALAGLWVCLILVAAVFIGARLAVLTPTVLQEQLGIGAIARSWRLTRAVTWKIVGVELLFALVLVVAIMAMRFAGGTLLALIAGGEKPITVASVLTAVAVAAVQTVGTVYILAFFAQLYVAVRDRHEARPATA